MSDYILKLIPVDPFFIPDEAAQQTAVEWLTAWLPAAEVISGAASESVTFVDPGANLERVGCPACGRDLDLMEWQGYMDATYANGFTDLMVTMRCCGAVGSLHDLDYRWPAGFACFVLEILNPGGDISDEQLGELGRTLGCELRVIRAIY